MEFSKNYLGEFSAGCLNENDRFLPVNRFRMEARWWFVSLVDSTIVIDWREMLDGEKAWMIRGMPVRISFIHLASRT